MKQKSMAILILAVFVLGLTACTVSLGGEKKDTGGQEANIDATIAAGVSLTKTAMDAQATIDAMNTAAAQETKPTVQPTPTIDTGQIATSVVATQEALNAVSTQIAATQTALAVPATQPPATPTPQPPTATPKPKPATTSPPQPTATPKPTATPTPTETPTAAANSGHIAFAAFDGTRGTYDLYVVNADGSGLTRVFDGASQPDIRPDGQVIAFRNWHADNRSISSINLYGGGFVRYTNFLEDGYPSWSPDGTAIVFQSRREIDRKSRIYMLNVSGRNDWVLTRGGNAVYGEYPDWSPDGRIYYRSESAQIELGVMNNDGGGYHTLLGDGSVAAPKVSPDGHTLVFMSQRDDNWEVYRANADGSGLQRLTNHPNQDGLPTWSPDGKTIAFVSDRSGHWALWLMNPDGSNQRQLIQLPGSLDGHVAGEPDYSSRGWTEEQISWGP